VSTVPERPPRVGLRLTVRALLACAVVMVVTAAAVATAALRELDDILDPIRKPGRADIRIPELDIPPPGGPRTFMILGSDKREGVDRFSPPRSDTILLARADPDKDAVTVVSIPRDLKVEIPGHGTDKINAAFELGGRKNGPALVVRTIKKLFKDKTGENLPITNVMVMDYGAFRRAVDYIVGVYVDVDRHYFNDNSPPYGGGPDYATINVPAGYQRLCGQDALDYVRYRHFDSDLVRAARQQDFLRQAKDQVGVSKIFGDREALLKIFGKYTQTDIRGTTAILRLLKLVAESAGHPVQEIHFPGVAGPTYVTASRSALDSAVHDFLNAKGSSKPRGQAKPEKSTPHRRRSRPGVPPGLVLNKNLGEDQAIALQTHLKFPVLYPKLLAARGAYRVDDRRAYDIFDRGKHKYRAYRIVASEGDIGQYYGIQGMNWSSPPILDNPSETRMLNGRKFELFFDGSRLRLVAYRRKNDVYWVSNTLLETLTNKQMLALAESLTRIGH
jgi:LCP family protein required for cell wall assembly